MPIFSNPFVLLATISLIIQAIVIFLLFYGYWLKNKANFPWHARIMTTAVILHITMIFAFMVPAFILALIPIFIVPHLSDLTSLIALIHAPLGVAAVSLGLFLVLSWRHSGLTGCFKRKKIMIATMAVWLTALFFGFALYAVLYWAALMS
jgi:uncharacterized membrane protein YozB (DUF420 family)